MLGNVKKLFKLSRRKSKSPVFLSIKDILDADETAESFNEPSPFNKPFNSDEALEEEYPQFMGQTTDEDYTMLYDPLIIHKCETKKYEEDKYGHDMLDKPIKVIKTEYYIFGTRFDLPNNSRTFKTYDEALKELIKSVCNITGECD